ncbi:MAG: hypothetical protein PHH08_01930 [Candidatus ainarchaeum sp.]|nr:hypothetical protein [Candidatus ainarchaeum sp.]
MQEQEPIEEIVEKIAKECEEANASKWCIVKIIKELNGMEIKDAEKMRVRALEILKESDPKAANIFASFQRMVVRNSRQEIRPFDRGNIIKSLLKETEITRGVAEKIGREVEEKINELQISYLTTALIRELVNVKLLEYGHETVRNEYARLGLPVFEVEQKILKGPYSNRDILTEYCLAKAIPKELSDLHMSSDIFISNIGDFCTKPAGFAIRAERHQTLKKTIFECMKKERRLRRFFSWPLNIAEANIAIAALIEKKDAGEAADFFAGALECASGKPGGSLGLNFFMPEGNGFEADNETMIVVANKIIEKTRQARAGMPPALLLDTKYKINLVNAKQCKKIDFINCKKNYLLPVNGFAAKNGILCAIHINLLKQAVQNSPERFLERIEFLALKAGQLAELKTRELEKRDYLKKHGIDASKMQPVLGLFGLMQACRQTLQVPSKKKNIDLCNKALEKTKKALGEEWIIAETENPLAIKRFEAKNRELKLESKQDDKKALLKADLQKSIFFRGEAKNMGSFNKLMDENVPWIMFKS